MNHYPRHIGDYLKDTAHLSLLEHGVYARLLDVYYTREGPIPQDQVARLIGARTKDEREAMETVLREFFILSDDGVYRQKRADVEIAAYLAGEPEREVKKTNETLRLQRHRIERAGLFAQLHERGLHADWNIKMADLRALVQRHCNADRNGTGNALQPLPETPPATAPATPDTATNTNPNTNPNIKTMGGDNARAGEAALAMRKAGASSVNPSHPDLLDLLAKGVSAQQLGDLTAELIERHGPKPQAYILATMANRLANPTTPAAPIPRQSKRRTIHDERADTIAALTGASKCPGERDITGIAERVD